MKQAVRKDLVKIPVPDRTSEQLEQIIAQKIPLLALTIKNYATGKGKLRFKNRKGFGYKNMGVPTKIQEKDVLPFSSNARDAYVAVRNKTRNEKTKMIKAINQRKRIEAGIEPKKEKKKCKRSPDRKS